MARTAPRARLEAAAGGRGGSWYVLLEGLARLVLEIHPEIEVVVVEGGGVDNHVRVGLGALPMAILNPPMTAAALAGRAPFDRAYPDLRLGVDSLTTNYLQLMVDERVPLASLAEWGATRHPLRIPVDRVGTVDRMVFDLALEHMGLSILALERAGGRAVPAANYDEQLALYRAGEVDALWQFMAIPSPSIRQAHASRPLRALPLPEDLIARLAALGWERAALPAGAYGMVTRPVATVSMGTSLGFHAAVSDDTVHAVVGAICDHPARVRAIHPAAEHFDPARAHASHGGPLHPGAARYYRR